MNTMHLFAGAGGGLLCDLILGHNPIVAVEWEPYACQVLRERAADGWFPDLHVWEGDVRLFDPSEYAGSVDCIHAGFPCQDISVAGKQAGVEDGTRSGLYREVLRIARIVRPVRIFLENVSAILSNGLGTVLADLAALGYDARWICLRASDVGANHQRDRWWLLATMADATNERVHERWGFNAVGEGVQQLRGNVSDGIQGGGQEEAFVLADTMQQRQQGQGQFVNACDSEEGCERQTGNAFDVCIGGKRSVKPCMGELADGLADGVDSGWWEIEPDVGRVANGVSNRTGQLKANGNGQVPLQAAVAWRLLGGE